MYFSRAQPDRDADYRKLMGLGGYREHQVIWRLFERDDAASRDFLFRREEQEGWPVYYIVSRRPPVVEDAHWNIETKHYQPNLAPGQRLAFNLRANPVVTRKDDSGRRKRSDIVMDLKKQSGWQKQPVAERADMPMLIEQAGRQWLESRLDRRGARLDTLMADGYRQHQHVKPGSREPIRFATIDFSGVLTVADPERLSDALFHGIGPAKAFGCGLMLVRRCTI